MEVSNSSLVPELYSSVKTASIVHYQTAEKHRKVKFKRATCVSHTPRPPTADVLVTAPGTVPRHTVHAAEEGAWLCLVSFVCYCKDP